MAWGIALAAAAVNALPSLLDELDRLETDVAEAEGDAQRYWPFVERAERAELALQRVRELHRESHGSMSALYADTCGCGADSAFSTSHSHIAPLDVLTSKETHHG